MVKESCCQVLKCDIRKERPPESAVLPLGDCLIFSRLLAPSWGHLRTLLSPRGYLVLTGGFETSFYTVEDKRFSFLPLEEKFLCEALQEVAS